MRLNSGTRHGSPKKPCPNPSGTDRSGGAGGAVNGGSANNWPGGGGGGYGGGGGAGITQSGKYTYMTGGGGGGGGKAGPSGTTTTGAGAAANTDGWVVITYTADTNPPTLSATNSSTSWFNSQRTATVSASDDINLVEVRYSFGTITQMNSGCTSGGTITSNSQSLNAPIGGTTLFLCARDGVGNVSTFSGNYNWENTPPSAPAKPTLVESWVGNHYLRTPFTISAPSGSTDSGGSLLNSYSLYACTNSRDLRSCSVVASGNLGTNVSMSRSQIPPNGTTMNYYWSSIDNAGNTSNGSPMEYITMDLAAPGMPILDAEPEYTSGTSNTVSSSISYDGPGIGGVEYNFCKSTTSLSIPFVECNTVSNQGGWISSNIFEFTNLSPGQIYYYYVKARDAISNDTPWLGPVYSTQGNIIQSAPEPEVIPVLQSDWNTDVSGTGQNGIVPIGVAAAVDPNIKIAELDVDFSSAPNWTGVTGGVEETKAFFHSEQSISVISNGAVSSYSLFVKKGDGNKVWVCPGASSLTDVNLSCIGGFFISDGQTVNGATATIDGIYWKISGLTGTGGMSIVSGLRDTLSRLQAGVGSDRSV